MDANKLKSVISACFWGRDPLGIYFMIPADERREVTGVVKFVNKIVLLRGNQELCSIILNPANELVRTAKEDRIADVLGSNFRILRGGK